MSGKRKSKPAIQRLMEKTSVPILPNGKDDPDKCWIYNGAKNNAGFGLLRGDHEAHREARMVSVTNIMALEMGIIKEYGEEVNHTCGTRLCVNPKHLIKGNPKQRYDLTMQRRGNQGTWLKHGPQGQKYITCPHCGITTFCTWFSRVHKNCGPGQEL